MNKKTNRAKPVTPKTGVTKTSRRDGGGGRGKGEEEWIDYVTE